MNPYRVQRQETVAVTVSVLRATVYIYKPVNNRQNRSISREHTNKSLLSCCAAALQVLPVCPLVRLSRSWFLTREEKGVGKTKLM